MRAGGSGGSFFDGLKANLIKACFCIKQEHEKYQPQEYFFKVRKLDGILKRN